MGYLRDRSRCAARREKMVGQHWEEGNRVIVVVPSGDGSGGGGWVNNHVPLSPILLI